MSVPHTDYDVLVVGFGLAGVCAAIAAAERGVRVLAVDRALGGGASALSGGVVYAGGGTPYQKEAGYDEDADSMFDYLRQEVGGVVDNDTLRRFCDGSVEQLAWLERHGAQFGSSLCEYKTSQSTDRHNLYFAGNERVYPYRQHAAPAPRGHRQVAKSMAGRALWEHLRDSALGLGVKFMPMTRVDHLIVDKGRVVGISCRTMVDDPRPTVALYRHSAKRGAELTNWMPRAGRFFNRIANHLWQREAQECTVTAGSVILAAGGFAFNRDMTRRYAPAYEQISPLGTETDDGKGILLGVSAGGATDHLDRISAWRSLGPPAALVHGVSVGVNGERIANEDLYGATHTEVMVRQFGGKGFLIADSVIWERARSQMSDQTPALQRPVPAWVFTLGHRKAATLTELAVKLGISPSGLADTVEAYNTGIITGAGDPAHKAADMCTPLQRGPFYGVDISIRPTWPYLSPGLTLGGLQVEEHSGLVRTEGGQAIAGLYAAGRNAVGICSNSYVSGLSLADCVFSGRRAGEHAASQSVTKPRGTVLPHRKWRD
jgi:3-oxo-5alpha-steroid 4-dehydrogenase